VKVFLDTDVILDFLLDRKPYSDNIGLIFQLGLANILQICVSPTTITNLNYIIGRIENRTQANLKTKKILTLVKVENLSETTMVKAI